MQATFAIGKKIEEICNLRQNMEDLQIYNQKQTVKPYELP
jgi:hypothetical protein